MRPSRPPVAVGAAAKAWEISSDDDVNAHLHLANYLIEAPGQSPAWSWYYFGVIDLSGTSADGTTAALHFPDARWEMIVLALDPNHEPYDPDNFELAWLNPPNVVLQLPDHPAELVADTAKALVIAVAAGYLAIEPMFTSEGLTAVWKALIEETLRHPYHHGDDR